MKKYTISKKEGWLCYKLDEFDLEEPFEIEVPIDCGCREIVTIGDEFQLPQSLTTYTYDKDFVKENKGKRVSIYSICLVITLPFGQNNLNDFIKNVHGDYTLNFLSLFNYLYTEKTALVKLKTNLIKEIRDEIVKFLKNLTRDKIATYETELNNTLHNFLYTKGFSLYNLRIKINDI